MHNALYYGVLALAATSVSARAVPGLTPRHDFSKTGNCSPQPLGAGPVTSPDDTADAFRANPVYANYANSAATPQGYSLAYQNLLGASTTGGYLGYRSYSTYDPSVCAKECCGNPDLAGCTSFNIYFERDPVIDPGAACPNPNSTTYIKCSFWSQALVPTDATNDGQYCADFHIVIAGSNGYNVVGGGCSAPSTTTTTTKSATTTTTKKVTTTKSVTTSCTTKASTTTKPASASTLTACPVPETTYTAKDGSTWAICKGTDYQGQTNEDVHNIYNDNDCAEACASRNGCIKGVFNPAGSVCYIKSTSLVWANNPSYDTVRELTPPTPKTLTACPTPELQYTAKDGSTWAICKGTDYQGNTYNAVPNVGDDNTCAEKCAADTAGCVKSVFDAVSNQCYLKNGGLTWVVNNRYDTIRELSGPTPKPSGNNGGNSGNNGGSNNGGNNNGGSNGGSNNDGSNNGGSNGGSTNGGSNGNNNNWSPWATPKKTCILGICF